jgi:hypothetical protein
LRSGADEPVELRQRIVHVGHDQAAHWKSRGETSKMLGIAKYLNARSRPAASLADSMRAVCCGASAGASIEASPGWTGSSNSDVVA